MARSTERGMGMAENKGSSKVDDYDDDEELTSTELTGFRDKLMDEAKRVQNLLTNHLDSCLDMRPPNIRTIIEGNPQASSWTGREPPYGYLDWWPISLGFNALAEPFDDAEIRWAINHAIDREQLVEIGWQGSGSSTLLPFPDYPPLRKYTSAIGDLLEKYPVGVYMLPKHLDEKVARLHLNKLGVEIDELSVDQAEYLGIPVQGPYKPEHYRY